MIWWLLKILSGGTFSDEGFTWCCIVPDKMEVVWVAWLDYLLAAKFDLSLRDMGEIVGNLLEKKCNWRYQNNAYNDSIQWLMQFWSPVYLKAFYEEGQKHILTFHIQIQIYTQLLRWFLSCHDPKFPREQMKASKWLHPAAHLHLFLSATHHTDTALTSNTYIQCTQAKGRFSKATKSLVGSHVHI